MKLDSSTGSTPPALSKSNGLTIKCEAFGCGWPVIAKVGIPLERGLVEVVYYCRSHAKGMEKFAGAEILERSDDTPCS